MDVKVARQRARSGFALRPLQLSGRHEAVHEGHLPKGNLYRIKPPRVQGENGSLLVLATIHSSLNLPRYETEDRMRCQAHGTH